MTIHLHDPNSNIVNHPRHYNTHSSGVECIDVIEWLPGNLHSAVKYLWRKDEKGKPREDVEKSLWYVRREIARCPEVTTAESIPSEIRYLIDKWSEHEPDGWRKDVILQLLYVPTFYHQRLNVVAANFLRDAEKILSTALDENLI